jgi:hypothetical protein
MDKPSNAGISQLAAGFPAWMRIVSDQLAIYVFYGKPRKAHGFRSESRAKQDWTYLFEI